MNKKLVSIIMPVYQAEKFLCDTINSVLAQTYSNWELILVDDGSTDSSGEICDTYAQKDSRVKVVHKINGGVSSARNIGLQMIKGKYLTFIDPDDFINIDTYEENMNIMINNSEIDILQYPFCKLHSTKLKELKLYSPTGGQEVPSIIPYGIKYSKKKYSIISPF